MKKLTLIIATFAISYSLQATKNHANLFNFNNGNRPSYRSHQINTSPAIHVAALQEEALDDFELEAMNTPYQLSILNKKMLIGLALLGLASHLIHNPEATKQNIKK